MLTTILKAAYLMLPAYFANMAPVFCKHIPYFNMPIDSGKRLGGKPLFGRHKTWRGLISAVIFGLMIAYIQHRFSYYFPSILLMDYDRWYIIGFLLGLGAILGDLIESMFKRQFNIKEGGFFFPFDQLDFVIGALVLLTFYYVPSWDILLAIIVLSLVLHPITNHIGYYLRLRDTKW